MTVDVRALKRLLSRPQEVLRALDLPCRDEARRTLDVSQFLVPRGDPTDGSHLAETGFLLGPTYNPEVLSTTWLSGYEHPAAGAIHEGFHWGQQTVHPPPHWLKKSFKGAKPRVRKSVAAALQEALRRFFPS